MTYEQVTKITADYLAHLQGAARKAGGGRRSDSYYYSALGQVALWNALTAKAPKNARLRDYARLNGLADSILQLPARRGRAA